MHLRRPGFAPNAFTYHRLMRRHVAREEVDVVHVDRLGDATARRRPRRGGCPGRADTLRSDSRSARSRRSPPSIAPSRLRHVLHDEAEVIDDAAGRGQRVLGLSQHDEHARELNQLQRPVLHECAAQRDPETLLRIDVAHVQMDVSHADAELVRFDELRGRGIAHSRPTARQSQESGHTISCAPAPGSTPRSPCGSRPALRRSPRATAVPRCPRRPSCAGRTRTLQLVERRGLQRQQVRRVDEDLLAVERLQVADDLVELPRVDAGLAQLLAQRLGVVLPLAQLVAELADVVRVEAARPFQ